jgi:tRNA (guanine37-N1)-methyltransferase
MHFDIITLFPQAFSYLRYGVIGKAIDNNIFSVKIHNLREYGIGKRRNVDDKPFGGGPGMIMMIEPIYRCLKAINAYPSDNLTEVILFSPRGKVFTQRVASQIYRQKSRSVLICGRYEGVDERVVYLCTKILSVGKYILSGGELPAMIVLDTIARFIPGVLGNRDSLKLESFSKNTNLKEYPQYTRPDVFITEEGDNLAVPDVLLSGNHKKIQDWRDYCAHSN